MKNKYYDLIISLIKKHRKYSGLETILEDIANDVYEHSKVVIASVANEEVVTSYLEKVVSTSIVTVPKKLNFNTRNRHRVTSNIIVDTNSVLQEKEFDDNVQINTEVKSSESEKFSTEKELETEPILETINGEEELLDEPILLEESLEEQLASQDELYTFEEPLNETQEEIENLEIEEEEEEEEEEEVDRTLVEKMINGTSIDKASKNNKIEELFSEEITEVYETIETIEAVEENEEELADDFAEDSELLEETEHSFNLDLENSEPSFDIEEIAETIESLEPVEDTKSLLGDVLETESEDLVDETLEIKNTESSEHFIDFNPPSFDCFNFEYKKSDYDTTEIIAELEDIEQKHPERKILTICDLKYSQNLSVQEIAQKIGFTEEEVLDVLNEIIEIVKD